MFASIETILHVHYIDARFIIALHEKEFEKPIKIEKFWKCCASKVRDEFYDNTTCELSFDDNRMLKQIVDWKEIEWVDYSSFASFIMWRMLLKSCWENKVEITL